MSFVFASFVVIIYTTNNTATAAAISAKGKDKVKKNKDKFDNTISKSIFLGCF
jgi:hypothetical protein